MNNDVTDISLPVDDADAVERRVLAMQAAHDDGDVLEINERPARYEQE